MAIRVEVTPIQHGGYNAEPVSKRVSALYADHMLEFTGNHSAAAFFQGDYELPDSLRRNPRAMRELDAGFSAVVLVDPWDFGVWLGYDAQNVEI